MTGSGFEPFVVETSGGPHVTMQAGIVLGDRYWTTTSRNSLKARMIHRHGRAGVLIGERTDRPRSITGRARVLDPTDPRTWIGDPVGASLAPTAMAALAVAHADQLRGYLASWSEIPSEWSFDQRVILSVRLDRRFRSRTHRHQAAWSDLVATTSLDAPSPAALAIDALDDDVAELFRPNRAVRVGLVASNGPVVVPARWDVDRRLVVDRRLIDRVGAVLPGAACVMADDSADPRPTHKRGSMLRGRIDLAEVADDHVRLALDTERVTTWDGFGATTEPVG